MKQLEEHAKYLPPDFLKVIEPHISAETRQKITSRTELLNLWQTAINSYRKHPAQKEAIAEWTLSAGATSPLITDDPQLHEIHVTFGELELPEGHVIVRPGETVDDRWEQLASLIEEAGKQ